MQGMHPLWGAFLFYYVRLVLFCASKLILSEYTQIFTSHILKKNVILHKRKTT